MSKSTIRVFKFGGASVQNAASIRNVTELIRSQRTTPLLVVVSAMGKMTNALERLVNDYRSGSDYRKELAFIKKYHDDVLSELFEKGDDLFDKIEFTFTELEKQLFQPGEYDEVYDQVVSFGEILSTQILAAFLTKNSIPTVWVDARKVVSTDSSWREGKIRWEETEKNCQPLLFALNDHVMITQGFLGSDSNHKTVTLGRDGSDFSAAIFASCLHAQSVTIWKDVPGVMNADPKRLSGAVVFDELPFKEAAEMTYYGASVIHPKTIKPLANKNIPLLVKNFDDPSLPGTKIHECSVFQLPPLIVFKDNQCLISCKVTDYTFFSEEQLQVVFQLVAGHGVHINVMQNSAISFSFCVDFRDNKIMPLIGELSKHFEVYYNTGLTLITIKNYDQKTFNEYRSKKGVILEQSSRSTLQVLLKN